MIDIDGHHLSLEQVVRVARDNETVAISSAGKENIERSRKNLEVILATGRPVYGINTGFGIFAGRDDGTREHLDQGAFGRAL